MTELLSFILRQGDQFRRQRLASLYSDFTFQRQSNPDGFTANISAWIGGLEKAAWAGLLPADRSDEHCILSLTTGETLLRSLETQDWGRPQALGTVVDEAVSQHQWMPYKHFIAARGNLYNSQWKIQPWLLFTWGSYQLGLSKSATNARTLSPGRFVMLSNVERAGQAILKQIANQTNRLNRIFPMSHFRTWVGELLNLDKELSNSDLQIILVHLSRDKASISYDSQTIKFKEAGQSVSLLSEQDRTISSLKSIIIDLTAQIEELSARIATLSAKAQRSLDSKDRTSALAALRSKKLHETALTHRSDTLAQVEEVYNKIGQAADQLTIVRTMEASAKVLQNLHTEMGGVAQVDDIIEDLRDEMSKVDEISSALEAGSQANHDIDQNAVHEEFEYMEKKSKMKAEEAQALATHKKLDVADDFNRPDQDSKPKVCASSDPPINLMEEGVQALKGLSLDSDGSCNENRIVEREPDTVAES